MCHSAPEHMITEDYSRSLRTLNRQERRYATSTKRQTHTQNLPIMPPPQITRITISRRRAKRGWEKGSHQSQSQKPGSSIDRHTWPKSPKPRRAAAVAIIPTAGKERSLISGKIDKARESKKGKWSGRGSRNLTLGPKM